MGAEFSDLTWPSRRSRFNRFHDSITKQRLRYSAAVLIRCFQLLNDINAMNRSSRSSRGSGDAPLSAEEKIAKLERQLLRKNQLLQELGSRCQQLLEVSRELQKHQIEMKAELSKMRKERDWAISQLSHSESTVVSQKSISLDVSNQTAPSLSPASSPNRTASDAKESPMSSEAVSSEASPLLSARIALCRLIAVIEGISDSDNLPNEALLSRAWDAVHMIAHTALDIDAAAALLEDLLEVANRLDEQKGGGDGPKVSLLARFLECVEEGTTQLGEYIEQRMMTDGGG